METPNQLYSSLDFTVTSQKNVVPVWYLQPLKHLRLETEVGVYYLGYENIVL